MLKLSDPEFWLDRIERAERDMEIAYKRLATIAIPGQLPLFIAFRSGYQLVDSEDNVLVPPSNPQVLVQELPEHK